MKRTTRIRAAIWFLLAKLCDRGAARLTTWRDKSTANAMKLIMDAAKEQQQS